MYFNNKDMKLEVTNHKCSSKLVSIIVNGECIVSRFMNLRPGSFLTTQFNEAIMDSVLSTHGLYECLPLPKTVLKLPKLTFKKYSPPALTSPL